MPSMPSSASRMPALFLGHGSPMNALLDNEFTRAWRALGAGLPRPRAILMISAHWQTRGTAMTTLKAPPTLHDFGAFPKSLFDVRYPAPGDPALVEQAAGLLAPLPVARDAGWGLDHGAWSVLRHLYPQADVPVVQLSMDYALAPAGHYDLGRRLRPLREQGVLIVGSGNVVHNLPAMSWQEPQRVYDWAQRFQDHVRACVAEGRDRELFDYLALGRDANLSVPSPDHFLPLFYVLGARGEDEPAGFRTERIEYGSLSMMSVVVGDAPA